MPRKRTIDKARVEYSLWHVSQLRHGRDWFTFAGGFGNLLDADDNEIPATLKAMKAAWPILREQVMAADRKHWGPCSYHRPWSWWKFDRGIDERLEPHEQKKWLLEHPQLLTEEEKAALG